MLAKTVWSLGVKMMPNDKHPISHVALLRLQLGHQPLGATNLTKTKKNTGFDTTSVTPLRNFFDFELINLQTRFKKTLSLT